MSAAALWTARPVPTWHEPLRLMDATLVRCGASRVTVNRSSLGEIAGYGMDKSHHAFYWGAKLMLITTTDGAVTGFSLACSKELDERKQALHRRRKVAFLADERPPQRDRFRTQALAQRSPPDRRFDHTHDQTADQEKAAGMDPKASVCSAGRLRGIAGSGRNSTKNGGHPSRRGWRPLAVYERFSAK